MPNDEARARKIMLRVGTTTLIFGTLILTNVAKADTDCTKVLVPKVTQFQASMEKWLALINLVKMTSDRQDQSKIGLSYGGVDLSSADAQAASSFYEQRTKYSLAETDTISLSTTEVPPNQVQGFVECVRGSKQDITISAPSGAENQEAFQIKVTWTPTYDVQVKENTTARTARLTITNGTPVSNDKIISPTNSVVFNVMRPSLDKPIFISASIDGRDSDFFSFPERPQFDLKLTPVKNALSIERSGQLGTTAVSLPLCLPDPQGDSQYLPETANKYVTGAGYLWDTVSSIDYSERTPLSVCAKVNTGGVGCVDPKPECYHKTTGNLSATLASIVKINYSR
jgi:hypothetical protein